MSHDVVYFLGGFVMLKMCTDVIGVCSLKKTLVFDNKTIQTDCTVTANEPMNTRTLRRVGVYLVQFNATISNTTSSSEFIGINMKRDGIVIPEVHTGATPSFTDDLVAMSFNTLIRVKQSCHVVDNTTRLQFKVTDAEDLVYFANVVVSKVE